jgi:NADPH2:quinone reductase
VERGSSTGLDEGRGKWIYGRIVFFMRAVVLEKTGQPLRLTTVASPEAGPGQVRVRVHASGVNPLDVKIHAGEAAHARQPAPAVLGLDLAGVVTALGPGVDRFRVGDEVYGMVGGVGGVPGTLVDETAVNAELLAKKPAKLTMREAAALPLVVITAWEGLVDRAAVTAGEKVLVIGGGGVGGIVVQLARALGAEPTVAGRDDVVADLVTQHTGGHGFDVVYDTVGGAALDGAFTAVRRFGRVVSCLGWGTHALAPLSFRAASYSGVFTLLPLLTGEGQDHHGEILARAAELADAGKLTAHLDPRHFALGVADEAHRVVASGEARGKIVVDVAE